MRKITTPFLFPSKNGQITLIAVFNKADVKRLEAHTLYLLQSLAEKFSWSFSKTHGIRQKGYFLFPPAIHTRESLGHRTVERWLVARLRETPDSESHCRAFPTLSGFRKNYAALFSQKLSKVKSNHGFRIKSHVSLSCKGFLLYKTQRYSPRSPNFSSFIDNTSHLQGPETCNQRERGMKIL